MILRRCRHDATPCRHAISRHAAGFFFIARQSYAITIDDISRMSAAAATLLHACLLLMLPGRLRHAATLPAVTARCRLPRRAAFRRHATDAAIIDAAVMSHAVFSYAMMPPLTHTPLRRLLR